MTKQIRIYLFLFLATLLAGLPAYGKVGSGIITMTTSRNVGEQILLEIRADGDFTIEGAKGSSWSNYDRYYIIENQQIVIRGNVTKLKFTIAPSCKLTTLNVSGCPTLKTLYCSSNQLTSLDVTGCTALETLSCRGNQLTALDISSCTALTKLYCTDNQLTALDVSKNTALKEFYCSDNQLTALDVSGCTALKWLECYNNKLTSLDASGCTALTWLECFLGENRATLTTLDVSGCTALKTLKCYGNRLTTLDVSGCTALTELQCYNNELTSLDVSGCTTLWWLICYNNQLTTLDVSKNTALITLACHNNQLTVLDTSGCTALTELQCSNNQLTTLDVSGCTALTGLECPCNKLTALDVSGCTALRWLACPVNQIKGEEMTRLVKSLPDRTDKEAGKFLVVQEPAPEGNLCSTYDVGIARSKNWEVYKFYSYSEELVPYKGEDTYPAKVTLTKVGEGTLTATGAADLTAVPYGTELTIKATPAAGYELKALTANGADILATKKVVVKGATEIKATFTKKTAADSVEAGSVRLYPSPASTYVNVKAAKADALVRLYDANGTLLYEARTDDHGMLQIELSAYAEGTYLLLVDGNAQRLLIQR